MGIQGLLKALQPFSEKCNICDFGGQSLAVDVSSWLHKSVYSVSSQYVESTELSLTRLDPHCVRVATKYIEKRCDEMLTGARVRTIYLVLDGKRCPLKAPTNDDREARRQANLADARKFLKQGRQDKAEEKYKMCLKIHQTFANAVAAGIKKRYSRDGRVRCINSPHEADAQLVKLCMDGMANAIVTEDSDVLVYSASCHVPVPIIYKLDKINGNCDVVSMEWLLDWNQDRARKYKKSGGAMESHLLAFADRQSRRPGLGVRLFVQACVLAGSDYSPSQLNGVGTVTAFKLIRETSHRECDDRFRVVISSLSKKQKGTSDMIEYEELLAKSEAVFYLHPVVDARNKTVVTFTAPRMESGDENDHSKFGPVLQRFGGDLTFLGNVNVTPGMEGSDNNNNPPPDMVASPLTSAFPVREIAVVNKPAARRDAGTEVKGLVRAAKKNPYSKSNKRKPLVNVTNSAEEANPLSKFGFKKALKHDTYLNTKEDLRYVKRKFRKDGKPISNPHHNKSISELLPPRRQAAPLLQAPVAPAPLQLSHVDPPLLAPAAPIQLMNDAPTVNEFELAAVTNSNETRNTFYDHVNDEEDSLEEEPTRTGSFRSSYDAGKAKVASREPFFEHQYQPESFVHNTSSYAPRESFVTAEPTNSFARLSSSALEIDDSDDDDGLGAQSKYFARRVTKSPPTNEFAIAQPRSSPVNEFDIGRPRQMTRSPPNEFDIVAPQQPRRVTRSPAPTNEFAMQPRGVTSKYVASPENEFDVVAYANLTTVKKNKPSSPSDESNISELDEFREPDVAKFGDHQEVVDLSFDEPFATNLNPIQSQKRKQPTLNSMWSSQASSKSNGWFNARRKKERKDPIVHYFNGYQSVISETPGQRDYDDSFMGL